MYYLKTLEVDSPISSSNVASEVGDPIGKLHLVIISCMHNNCM